MRKLLKVFLALTAGLAIASCAKEYDDTELKGKVDALDKKVSALDQKVNALSEQVTGLAATIDEWKKGGFVESIQEIEGGYTITFLGGKTVTLYDGKDGKDGTNGTNGTNGTDGENGKTPQIISYNDELVWAIDGQPILVGGKPVPANVVPTFQIKEDGHLWMTLAGAETDLGKVVGEDGAGAAGDSILKSIEEKDGEVVFTLNGDPEVVYTIPMAKAFKLVIANKEYEAAAGATLKIDFTVTNGTAEMVDCFAGGLYSAKIVGSQVVVDVPDPFQAGQVLVWAQNDKGLFSMVKLSFITAAELVVVTPADEIEAIPSAAGDFVISLTSNVDVEVNEPAVDWVSAVITKADYTLTLTLLENETGEPRETEIEIVRADNGATVKTIKIVQLYSEPEPVPAAKPGDILWAEDWTGATNKMDMSTYANEGTTVYNDMKVTYTFVNGGSSTYTYLDTQMNADAEAQPNLLLSKTGGKWTISGIPAASATEVEFSYNLNNNKNLETKCVLTSPTEGVVIGERVLGGEKSKPYSAKHTITLPADIRTFTLEFSNTNSDNVRLDDLKIVVAGEVAPKELTVERLWGKYSTAEAAWNSYFSGTANSDRNLAMDDDYIYVPESSGTAKIWRIPVDGTSAVSTVNVEGVSGGTHAITCVRMVPNTAAAVNGGKDFLMGVSLTVDDESDALRVYSWGEGTDAAPTKTSAQTWCNRRLGDKFTVYGSLQDGALFFKDYANASDQGAFLVLRMAWSEVPKDGFFNPRRTNMFVEGGMGAYYPYPGDATNGIYTSTASSKYTSFTSSPLNTSPNTTGTFTDAGGYYVDAHGFNYFEYNGKRYIAYVKNAGSGDGRFYVIEGESTTSWADMLGAKRNVIYQAAIQEDLAFKDGDYHAELGANPSPKTSGNSGIDCAVRIKDDAVYFAVMKQHVGLSLFKMSMK